MMTHLAEVAARVQERQIASIDPDTRVDLEDLAERIVDVRREAIRLRNRASDLYDVYADPSAPQVKADSLFAQARGLDVIEGQLLHELNDGLVAAGLWAPHEIALHGHIWRVNARRNMATCLGAVLPSGDDDDEPNLADEIGLAAYEHALATRV